MATTEIRTEKLDLRLTPAAKQALAAAAAAGRQSVSEFVLSSALARAEESLALRRDFRLGVEKWEAFMKALDAPPRDLPRVEALSGRSSVFEGGQPK